MTFVSDIEIPLLCVCIDEAQCVEADQMLRCLLEFEEQSVKPRPDQSVLLAHSLAMLWLLCNNYTKVNNKDRLMKCSIKKLHMIHLQYGPEFNTHLLTHCPA